MSDEHLGSGAFVAGIVLWFVLACALGASGRLSAITPPWPQVMIGAITLAIVLTGALHPGLRAWLAHVNLRGFVAFHVTRFIGIAFLVLSARGELSRAWAIPAGWGDIVVALGALLIALIMRDPQARPALLGFWNVLGFADIVLVVVTAARTGLGDPSRMAPLFRFPMSLVPTFIVPFVIASHLLVFWRLGRGASPHAR